MNKEERIKEALAMLEESGLSDYKVSKDTGLSANQIGRWKKGLNIPSDANLETLRAYLVNYKNGTGSISPEEIARSITGGLKRLIIEDFSYVPLVHVRARAGYLCGYGDQQFIETLPIIPVIADKTFKGVYRCFEVEGDSMYDGSVDSIKDGDKILGREVKKDLWHSKLHIKDWYFIIVHKDGVMVKQIVKHDVDKGTITCHSLNPIYGDDFELSLNDTYELYNVVQIVSRQMKL